MVHLTNSYRSVVHLFPEEHKTFRANKWADDSLWLHTRLHRNLGSNINPKLVPLNYCCLVAPV